MAKAIFLFQQVFFYDLNFMADNVNLFNLHLDQKFDLGYIV